MRYPQENINIERGDVLLYINCQLQWKNAVSKAYWSAFVDYHERFQLPTIRLGGNLILSWQTMNADQ